MPETRRDVWSEKIQQKIRRDKESVKKLKQDGWKVKRIWEHETRKNPDFAVKKIIS
jgi:DNA mismatch endonuclease (patch repair protein)